MEKCQVLEKQLVLKFTDGLTRVKHFITSQWRVTLLPTASPATQTLLGRPNIKERT